MKKLFGLLSMKFSKRSSSLHQILLLLILVLSPGINVQALEYDYSFTRECLEDPLKPQYQGGIVLNPDFFQGIKGWSPFGSASIEKRESDLGNSFIVAMNRSQERDSFSQKIKLKNNTFYTISGWLRTSHEEANVAAVIKTSDGVHHYAGWSIARSGCWSMLKGGLALDYSGPAELYFESDHRSTELWADSISVQPFTQEEWTSHWNQSVEKVRKSKVKIRAIDHFTGTPMVNAKVEIKGVRINFPLGNALSNKILTIPAYQDWFARRFRYAVFENEMKWQWNEPQPGQEDYHLADGMFQFVQKNNIQTRGHNIVWENDFWLPNWAKTLDPIQLKNATRRRQSSIMKRYRGQVIHWDVVNENLHYRYFEDTFGSSRASSVFYKRAWGIDGEAIMFLNDYNTIEKPSDKMVSPARYLEKIDLLRSQGYDGPLGIGLQGHFYSPPIPPYIRSALDALATAKLPIWISELDVDGNWTQAAEYLEQILRELQAHPAVDGIMIWAPWSPPDCYRMCITDAKFTNLPTGDVVDKLLDEWSHAGCLVGKTDKDGYFRSSLFHGDYELRINHPSVTFSSDKSYKFKVESSGRAKHYVLNISTEASTN